MEKINNTIKSATPPQDVHALWLNTEDNVLYAFDFSTGWQAVSRTEPPTDYARQGDNPNATLSDTQAAVESLTALDSDITSGKVRMAAAISNKGVPTSSQDSMADMATKIGQIPQQVNTRTSDFEQMIAPTPYMWNVYSIASDLMKETLPDYLPTYMQDYKSRYGTNSFFVGEYYLGYASLELTGADGYLTNDGDFYTISDGVVTHTLPDGTVETYSDSTIVHKWHDDDTYCNRWVAFFYLNNAYQFTNINSAICPRRVALCGTCNSFIVSGENRLTDVWVIGELGHFEGGTTGNTWNPAQVIRNYITHSGGYIYTNPTNVVSIVLPDLEDMASMILTGSSSSLQVLCLPKLNTMFGGTVDLRNFSNLKYVLLANSGDIALSGVARYYYFDDSANPALHIPNITSIKFTNSPTGIKYIFDGYLKELYCDNLKKIETDVSYILVKDSNTIEKIYLPMLETSFYLSLGNFAKLRDIWLGNISSTIYLIAWSATDITSTPEGIVEINANIRNHIAARIKDMTGETSPTITFGANLFNNLEQETLDAFVAKNWTVASA